jgi:choline dehydrogenase-like flavoprotein
MTRAVNVCVIGSGVAGGTVCKHLLAAGVSDVLMIEQGGVVPMRDPRTWQDYAMAGRNPFAGAGIPASEYRNVGTAEYSLEDRLLQLRGGSTLHWDGWSYRLNPEDFRLRTNAGCGADWPISYDELEPFYAEAERALGVAGDATDAGHPPRSGPFPLPPMPFQLSNDPFIDAMERLQYSVQHHCLARNTLPINDMPQCMTFGTCHYCPIGGRFTGDQLIDRLETQDGFRIMTNTAVRRILFSAKRKASGVELVDRESGRVFTVEAETIVVCGGAIQTPKLLLQSANPFWPDGVGNDSGHVGRFLFNHLRSDRVGALPSNKLHLTNELDAYDLVSSRHFDSERFQARGKFLLTCEPVYERSIADRMADGWSVEQISHELDGHVFYQINAQIEQCPEPENLIRLGKAVGADGMPSIEIAYSIDDRTMATHVAAKTVCDEILQAMGCELAGAMRPGKLPGPTAHHMGTCRMTASPGDGVVDPHLMIHGTDNVFVCGSSVFPSGGAANPTLTITALAQRLGIHLATDKRVAPAPGPG